MILRKIFRVLLILRISLRMLIADPVSFELFKDGMKKEFASIVDKHKKKILYIKIVVDASNHLQDPLLNEFRKANQKKMSNSDIACFEQIMRYKLEEHVKKITGEK